MSYSSLQHYTSSAPFLTEMRMRNHAGDYFEAAAMICEHGVKQL